MTCVEAQGEAQRFGTVLRQYREARSMSQARLAEEAKLSAGYVSLLETGGRGKRPSRDVVIALAQALRAEPAVFLRAAGRLQPGEGLSPDERMSFEDFVQTDPALRADQKRMLIELYRSYVRT